MSYSEPPKPGPKAPQGTPIGAFANAHTGPVDAEQIVTGIETMLSGLRPTTPGEALMDHLHDALYARKAQDRNTAFIVLGWPAYALLTVEIRRQLHLDEGAWPTEYGGAAIVLDRRAPGIQLLGDASDEALRR